MSSVVIAFFIAAGVSGWTYSKVTRRTGGLTQSDMIVTGTVGVIVFFVAWSLISMIPTD